MNEKWIALNEKIPPLGECIICTVKDHIRNRLELRYPVYYIKMPYTEGYAFHFGEIGNVLLPDVSEVLAWMPMPTVYQKTLIDCEECNGSGFSSSGTGYDSVCDNCGGKGEHPNY